MVPSTCTNTGLDLSMFAGSRMAEVVTVRSSLHPVSWEKKSWVTVLTTTVFGGRPLTDVGTFGHEPLPHVAM